MTATVPVRLSVELLEAIDAVRDARPMAGYSRSQAIRDLLVEALEQRKGKRK